MAMYINIACYINSTHILNKTKKLFYVFLCFMMFLFCFYAIIGMILFDLNDILGNGSTLSAIGWLVSGFDVSNDHTSFRIRSIVSIAMKGAHSFSVYSKVRSKGSMIRSAMAYLLLIRIPLVVKKASSSFRHTSMRFSCDIEAALNSAGVAVAIGPFVSFSCFTHSPMHLSVMNVQPLSEQAYAAPFAQHWNGHARIRHVVDHTTQHEHAIGQRAKPMTRRDVDIFLGKV